VQGFTAGDAVSREPHQLVENKEFEQADFPLGNDKEGNARTKHLEGEYHYWDIGTRDGISEIQVYRNFLTALKNAGMTIDYANSPDQLVAHKGATWVFIESKGTFYYQTIVTEKQMPQEVTADAAALSAQIKKSGHIAVCGIQFVLPQLEMEKAFIR